MEADINLEIKGIDKCIFFMRQNSFALEITPISIDTPSHNGYASTIILRIASHN